MGTLTELRVRWPRWRWLARWQRVRDERPDLADFGTDIALDLSLAGRPCDPASRSGALGPGPVREGASPLLQAGGPGRQPARMRR
jgi:hypothetical protein